MKLKPTLIFIITAATMGSAPKNVFAQQYKLRQSTTMAGMKSESTIYVKGARKRTEGGGFMGMENTIVTIEQCDLQRTIKINDKKKLYYIEPFSKESVEMDEEVKPAPAKNKIAPPAGSPKEKTGGIINMWYAITDTGERKKMYGITARHIWTTQKIKPSADACMMKDSMTINTDGWYIDLPQFNCPVYGYASASMKPDVNQPACKDRFVSRRSGKGKLGFPLIEIRTMIMGNGTSQANEFKTSLETLEFSTMKPDSMLFEIPPGYKLAENEEELRDNFDVNAMMKQAGTISEEKESQTVNPRAPRKAVVTRIGVYEPKADESLQASVLQQHLVNTLSAGNVDAVAIASEDDARKYHCDLLLTTEFTKFKPGSKLGGLLKAIKNTDPAATSSYNIEATLSLSHLSDGSSRLQQKVSGKYDGKAGEAAMKALEKGCGELVSELKQE
jgi:hypothetical protein